MEKTDQDDGSTEKNRTRGLYGSVELKDRTCIQPGGSAGFLINRALNRLGQTCPPWSGKGDKWAIQPEKTDKGDKPVVQPGLRLGQTGKGDKWATVRPSPGPRSCFLQKSEKYTLLARRLEPWSAR